MKILASAVDQSIGSGSMTDISGCSWTADGSKKVLGFVAWGSWSGRFRLLINSVNCGEYMTSPEDRVAYVVGTPYTPTSTHVVKMQVQHEAGSNQTFSAWILEG